MTESEKAGIKHYIEILQAAAEGKEIQVLVAHEWECRGILELPGPWCNPKRIRIKPSEPKEYWITHSPNGVYDFAYKRKEDAEAYLKMSPNETITHVKEVI
jgi:hypothetical protein